MRMKTIAAVVAALAILSATASSEACADPWEAMRFFEGKWKGTGEGKSGTSAVEREYEFILGGNFIKGSTKAVFEPQEKNPKGEVHENLDVFSRDKSRDAVVLRQFHAEGFTNRYILESMSEDGKILLFVTEQIENGPPGMTARLVLEITGEDSFNERFEISTGGREYSCMITNSFERVKQR